MGRSLLKLAADTMDMQVDVLFDYSWYKGQSLILSYDNQGRLGVKTYVSSLLRLLGQ